MNKKLFISGIVQGVGFRPFIYKLALEYRLNGYVRNDAKGVYIHVQGDEENIHSFITKIKNNFPTLARIDSITIEDAVVQEYKDFQIITSQVSNTKTAIVSPDIAVCDKCLQELHSSSNRRFRYPLINCTECGPRYSIIKNLPYDRKYTSMNPFKMCKKCQDEYKDPLNRRYHAQPISCYDCGPTTKLYDNENLYENYESIQQLASLLKQGKIVAIKGIGGFHIVCDASNYEAVQTLRERKKRKKKPFALMFSDINSVKKNTFCTQKELELIESKERPIVIVEQNLDTLVAKNVAPDIKRLGVMLAYTPIHHLLFELIDFPIVATSANRSGEPIYRSYEQIKENLNMVVDAVLDFDRDIINAVDDSVVQVVDDKIQTLRLGRGYAPLSIPLKSPNSKKILAVGAQQKSAIALSLEKSVILSAYIGDLESLEAFEYFQRTVETFKGFYDFEPETIVFDKHPNYLSTKWAKEKSVAKVEIQHHYAHVLACMMEHSLSEKVLAFSFDGTGYGEDKTIWGSEVMLCDLTSSKRVGYIKPFALLGSALAVKEPRRVALCFLFESFGLEIKEKIDLEKLFGFDSNEIDMLYLAWRKKVNAPLTSSMGRVFDCVASLIGVLQVSDYDGQSGLLLESLCFDDTLAKFSYEINDGVINIEPMIDEILCLLIEDKKEEIPDRFINTIVEIICDFCDLFEELPVVFSGGVFQNKTLLQRAIKKLRANSRVCYKQEKTPMNDGSIALGQIAYTLYN